MPRKLQLSCDDRLLPTIERNRKIKRPIYCTAFFGDARRDLSRLSHFFIIDQRWVGVSALRR